MTFDGWGVTVSLANGFVNPKNREFDAISWEAVYSAHTLL